jgi:hypothetical protein
MPHTRIVFATLFRQFENPTVSLDWNLGDIHFLLSRRERLIIHVADTTAY